jgi:uncharacterized protein with PQ loop repeat
MRGFDTTCQKAHSARSILAFGIAMWVVYDLLKMDAVIILANSVSLCLLAAILFFKLRNSCLQNSRPDC